MGAARAATPTVGQVIGQAVPEAVAAARRPDEGLGPIVGGVALRPVERLAPPTTSTVVDATVLAPRRLALLEVIHCYAALSASFLRVRVVEGYTRTLKKHTIINTLLTPYEPSQVVEP